MKHTFLLLALFSCFVFAQCKKDKNSFEPDNSYGLPNATQKGANIFACRVNGENWISGKGINLISGGVSGDTLSARGQTGDNNYFDIIEFVIKGGAIEGGQYNFSETSGKTIILRTNKTCNGYSGSNILQLVATSGAGTISKIDRANKIISGTFSCKIPVPTCDTLDITDGRFDISYF